MWRIVNALRLLPVLAIAGGCSKGADGLRATHPDPARGLAWQAEASTSRRTWHEAREYCETLDLAGGGWRLPTETELGALYHSEEPEFATYRGWKEWPTPPVTRNTAASGLYWSASAEASCNDDEEPPAPIVARGGVVDSRSALFAWAVALRTNEVSESHQGERGNLVCILAEHPARVRCVRDLPRATDTKNEGTYE